MSSSSPIPCSRGDADPSPDTSRASKVSSPQQCRTARPRPVRQRGIAVLEALDEIARAHNAEVATVALGWLLAQPSVLSPIASARNVEQPAPIKGTFGAAIKSHGETIYYGRLPKTCPTGGFPVKTETIFAENGEPSTPEKVTAVYKVPCPRRFASSQPDRVVPVR